MASFTVKSNSDLPAAAVALRSDSFERVCPAGSLPALRAAVDNGASCVYLGLRDATKARNFIGLNFDEAAIAGGITNAQERSCKVFMALNTYPQAANPGLLLKTCENEEFLVINGTQTQSSRVYNLVDSRDEMRALGVDVLRLSPQAQHMSGIAGHFDAARRQALAPDEALARIQPLMPGPGCNDCWNGRPGLAQTQAAGTLEAP